MREIKEMVHPVTQERFRPLVNAVKRILIRLSEGEFHRTCLME